MTYIGNGSYGDALFVEKDGTLAYSHAPVYPVLALSDLPDPVSGVITLPANTTWQIIGTVDIGTNRIVLSEGTALIGELPGQATIKGNSAVPLIVSSVTAGSREVAGLTVTNTGGAGVQFGTSTSRGFIDRVIFKDCAGIAIRLVAAGEVTVNLVTIENCVAGVELSGSLGAVSLYSVDAYTNPSGFVGIDFVSGAAAQELRVDSCSIQAANVADVGLRLNGTVLSRALIEGCQILGAGTRLTGTITQGTIGWSFLNNQGLRDSCVVGDGRFVSSTNVTVTPTATNQWFAANTATTPMTVSASERFTLVGVDSLQYTGIDPVNLLVVAQVSMEHGASNNDYFEITCQRGATPAIGSTTDDPYRTGSEINGNQATQIQTTFVVLDVKQNDTFRILLRNVANTDSAQIFSTSLTISEA